MTWDQVTDSFLHPVMLFFDPREKLSIIYLFTALVVAIGVYVYRRNKGELPAGKRLWHWLFPREVLLHPSARADYIMFFFNKSLIVLIYASILVQSNFWYDRMVGTFGQPQEAELSLGVTVLAAVAILLATDFALWLGHYIFHKVPFLWEFHKAHHSAEVMTPITAVRMHPVDEAFSSVLGGIAIGTTAAACDLIFGKGAQPFSMIGYHLFLLTFYAAAFNLRHSHVWVRYPGWLGYIFVSPAQHQIHHSRARKHWDKNMGFVFAFWDWAAGTLYAPKRYEEIDYGLGNGEDGTWNTVTALYFRPFVNAARLFRQGWRKALVSNPTPLDDTQDSKPESNSI